MQIRERALSVDQTTSLLHILRGRRDQVGYKPEVPDLSQENNPLLENLLTPDNRISNIGDILLLSHAIALENFWKFRFQSDMDNIPQDKEITDAITLGNTTYVVTHKRNNLFEIVRLKNFQEKVRLIIHYGDKQEVEYGDKYRLIFLEEEMLYINNPIEAIQESYKLLSEMQRTLIANEKGEKENTPNDDFLQAVSLSMSQETDRNTAKNRERRFQRLMLYEYVTTGDLEKELQQLQVVDSLSPTMRTQTEIELVNVHLDYIAAQYPENAHPEESTIGAELEIMPPNAVADIKKSIQVTADQLHMSEEQLVGYITRLMSDSRSNKDLAICFEKLKLLNSENIADIKQFIAPHISAILPRNSSLSEKNKLLKIIALLDKWGRTIHFPLLEAFQRIGTFTYEEPHIIANGGYPPIGRAEIQTYPAYNDEILSREVKAYVRLGLAQGDVFPQFTNDIETNEKHHEMMIAHVIGIAAGKYGLTFSKNKIHDFEVGLDYWHEPYPKRSPNEQSNLWIPRHKSREGISDKTNRPAMYLYETSHEYGTESRIFQRWENAKVYATDNPRLFNIDESHWIQDFEQSAFYEKNTSTAILAVQTPASERSDNQNTMMYLWEQMIDKWSHLLQTYGIDNLPIDQYFVKVENGTWDYISHKKTPYEAFVTKVIVKRHNHPKFADAAELMWDKFQTSVFQSRMITLGKT